jgi:hypothetical protein
MIDYSVGFFLVDSGQEYSLALIISLAVVVVLFVACVFFFNGRRTG